MNTLNEATQAAFFHKIIENFLEVITTVIELQLQRDDQAGAHDIRQQEAQKQHILSMLEQVRKDAQFNHIRVQSEHEQALIQYDRLLLKRKEAHDAIDAIECKKTNLEASYKHYEGIYQAIERDLREKKIQVENYESDAKAIAEKKKKKKKKKNI